LLHSSQRAFEGMWDGERNGVSGLTVGDTGCDWVYVVATGCLGMCIWMVTTRRGDFLSIEDKTGQVVWIYNGPNKTRFQMKRRSWIRVGWTTKWLGQPLDPKW